MLLNCKICKKEFKPYKSSLRLGQAKYCSRKCQCIGQSISKKGISTTKMTDEVRKKISITKKGVSIWGDKRETPWMIGENNHNWKGDEVGYDALHDWVNRKKGKAEWCTFCQEGKSNNKFEWANLSGNYKRDIDDYIELCVLCHRGFDKELRKERDLLWEL